jgi:hypothetical protein
MSNSELFSSHGLQDLSHFDQTRASASPEVRLEATRAAALKLREELLADAPVPFFQTVNLRKVPYPTKYGLLNASRGILSPYMHILNRLFIIQFKSQGQIKTLLFSPSDIDANAETPYFKRLARSFGGLREILTPLLSPRLSTVEEALQKIGLRPEDVDYISYDHLHTQDLRKWLGSKNRAAYFPKARLLVRRQEWESAKALLPPQRDWYCPHGIEGIEESKIICFERTLKLGEGIALVPTPGHTEGNHSLAVHTPMGIVVSSENGVSADSFAPANSGIPGVRSYAAETGMEVVLNGNTLEGGLDQYISMVLEKTLAGPCQADGRFTNVMPSSEMTPYWLFPGLRPTFAFGPLKLGQLQKVSA